MYYFAARLDLDVNVNVNVDSICRMIQYCTYYDYDYLDCINDIHVAVIAAMAVDIHIEALSKTVTAVAGN